MHTPVLAHAGCHAHACVVPSAVSPRGLGGGGGWLGGWVQSLPCAPHTLTATPTPRLCWGHNHSAHRHHSGGWGGWGPSPPLTLLSGDIPPPSRTGPAPRVLSPFQPYTRAGGPGGHRAHTAHRAPRSPAQSTERPPLCPTPHIPPSAHSADPPSPPQPPGLRLPLTPRSPTSPPHTCTCRGFSSARPGPPRPARSCYGTPGRCGPPRRGRRWR